MARYYDNEDDPQTETWAPRQVLRRHMVDDFVSACEAARGRSVAAQARALLKGRTRFEQMNENALIHVMEFALEKDEVDFAVAVGDYLDRLNY